MSPALAKMRHVVLLVTSGIFLVVFLTLTMLLSLPTGLVVLTLVVLAAGVVVGWGAIERNAQRWGYAEADEELYIKHGALFRRLAVVPYGRMQYVDVQSGPVEQLFKIASVHLHTASPGTSALIPGLPADEAARLRDRLTSQGEAQAAGL